MGQKIDASGLVGQMKAYVESRTSKEVDVFRTNDGFVFVSKDADISDVNTRYGEYVDQIERGSGVNDSDLMEVYDARGDRVDYTKVLRCLVMEVELEMYEDLLDDYGNPEGFEKAERDGILLVY